jgi:long-chain acyl-CoA synthetase
MPAGPGSVAPHLAALTQAIEAAARRSPLYAVARRQMLAGLSEGYLAREGVLEKHFWAAVRKSVLGGFASSLRAVVVVDGQCLLPSAQLNDDCYADIEPGLPLSADTSAGGLTPTLLQSARVHLATPITNLTTSAQSTTPVFLTHFHDLQTIPSAQVSTVGLRELQFTPTSSAAYDKSKRSVVPGELVVPSEGVAHTGPPAVNIEVRLEGVDDEQIEEGVEDPQGDVWIRGPGVLADGCVRHTAFVLWSRESVS